MPGCGPPRKGLLRNCIACHRVLTAVPLLAAKLIRSARPKQETGERTRGRLVFRVRIQIVSLCASENQERGVCLCVRDLCEAVSFKTAKRHTCIHTQALTYRLFCGSICVPLAVQFEGVGHCSKQNAGWLVSGWSDSHGAQILN